jgi:hypothetical protein
MVRSIILSTLHRIAQMRILQSFRYLGNVELLGDFLGGVLGSIGDSYNSNPLYCLELWNMVQLGVATGSCKAT